MRDVLIVGGGPAGLATALAFRRRGATVTVADAMRPPIDKACGEGLMPDSLLELSSLGVHLSPDQGAAFSGIRFINHANSHGSVATAQFPAVGQAIGIGMKRQTLHAKLVEHAEEAGVDLRWGTPVSLQGDRQAEIAGQRVSYGILVGADGHSSRVRRWADLEKSSTYSKRFGFRQHFQVAPWSSYVEVHWSQSGQAYVTPVGPEEICIAIVARDSHCRISTLLGEMPQLRAKLHQRGIRNEELLATDRQRGAVTTTRRLMSVTRGKVALVGDASGSADAITGEGMGMAFRQALLLAECASTGNLARYNRLHPQILRLPQAMARIMLTMDRSPIFRDRANAMLAAQPGIFERMLGVHLGHESIAHFVATCGLKAAWRLAVPHRSTAHDPITT
jgi:flavin-dependent dehydrogenase